MAPIPIIWDRASLGAAAEDSVGDLATSGTIPKPWVLGTLGELVLNVEG